MNTFVLTGERLDNNRISDAQDIDLIASLILLERALGDQVLI